MGELSIDFFFKKNKRTDLDEQDPRRRLTRLESGSYHHRYQTGVCPALAGVVGRQLEDVARWVQVRHYPDLLMVLAMGDWYS